MRIISTRTDENGVRHGQLVDNGQVLNFTANPARENLEWTYPDPDDRPPKLYRENGSEFHWAIGERADDDKTTTVRIEHLKPGTTYWLVENPGPQNLKICEITVPPHGEMKWRELAYGEYGQIPASIRQRLHLPD